MKIVSVMTTSSAGGAEFAAVEMLDALAARGHDVVLLSDLPGIERDTAVRVEPLQIGPKLSVRSWRRLCCTGRGTSGDCAGRSSARCPTTFCSSTTRRSS